MKPKASYLAEFCIVLFIASLLISLVRDKAIDKMFVEFISFGIFIHGD
jgi:hypothetical protein